MNLTTPQRQLIERVVNALETGRPQGDYGALAIFNDGPHGIRQITYGRSQTTEYGKLPVLLSRYVEARGTYSADFARYADRVGTVPLTDDFQFRSLLRTAGRTDAVMREIQDAFFEREFFLPAMDWAKGHGFALPLSALAIYDSFIHSGSILSLIRRAFAERPPAAGGDERAWTTAYVAARHAWLAAHKRAAVRKTIYRTRCLTEQIRRGNWQLEGAIRANGVEVR